MEYDEGLRERCERNLGSFERRPHHGGAVGGDLRPAAVAIVVLPDDEGRGCFVLTRRASKLRDHAGQWALPGGRLDDGESHTQAALRECEEEVNLSLPAANVLGLLDDYPTRSGFVITPVVVWAERDSHMTPNEQEVARIYRVPLADLDHPAVPGLKSIPESDRPVITVPILDTHIHAPTAAILYQLREVVLHGRPTRVHHYEQPTWAWK